MTIDVSNAEIINKQVYIHDDVLTSLNFDRITKIMRLEIKKHMNSILYSMNLINVIGFSMTACDFWGESERICGIDYLKVQDRKLLPHLSCEWDKQAVFKTPFMIDDYIEVAMTFISGDKLRIVCEKIVIDEGF